jgi:hypothetical protein
MQFDDERENERLFIMSCLHSDMGEIRVHGVVMLQAFNEKYKS